MAYHRSILNKSVDLLSKVCGAESSNLSPSFRANFHKTLVEYALQGDETKKDVLLDIIKITSSICMNEFSKKCLSELEVIIKEG